MDLMVDAVQGSMAVPWAVAVSKRIAKQLEAYNVLWFEEPCSTEDISGYADVRSSTSVSIAGAESVPTAHAFKPFLDQGALDILQFDIATSGFTEGSRIASLAAAYRKPVAIHSWGTIVSMLAGVNMALTLPNCAITEYCFTDQPLNVLLSLVPI
jgi:D-galactarolactone cycloisomerase